jgi:tricorn protease
MRPGLLAFLFLTLVFPAVNSASAQQKGYYRKPCIHGSTVIFTAEGDLWKYDLGSGLTARLPTNEGLETEPAISPDGQQVVFTGQYEGGRRTITTLI